MISKVRKTGIIHHWTMIVDPAYKFIEKFQGGINWCMLKSKDFISGVNFIFINGNTEIVSFNRQSVTFKL